MKEILRSFSLFAVLVFVMSFSLVGCAPDGSKLFKSNCASCHNFKGYGGSICPDLTEVTKGRSDDWIRQQIKDPSVNDPNTKMQSFENLSDKEIQALIEYFKS